MNTAFRKGPSVERCSANSQGDKCRKILGHDATDPVHEGQFTIWQDGKFREEKFPRTKAKTA